MDDEIETLLVGVRADTGAFARDAAALRGALEGQVGSGAESAGAAIERGLLRAVRTGKLGFDDLKRVALSALAEIAAQAIAGGLGRIGGGEKGDGLVGLASGVLGGLLGLPGRATGGPVSPGRPYLVGERGPELFVPTSAGNVATGAQVRSVNVSVSIAAPADAAPRALARSSRQVARAVADALARADR